MGLPRLLDTWVPADDARLALDPAVVIAVMIANLTVEHRPLYALGEWAAGLLAVLGLDWGGGTAQRRPGRPDAGAGCSMLTGAACSPS